MVFSMRFPLKTLALAMILTASAAIPAKADIFFWRDADTKLSLSFPDQWRQIHNQQPDDVFTVAAPGDGEFATCRMRVREDARFVIYPRRYAANIQHINYSREFWDAYVGEFAGATINGVWDDAGLGDGFASFADVSFISPIDPKVQKRGLMFATVYNDKAYIAECSSETGAYGNWYKPFLSFVKSVDFRDEYQPGLNGWYRNFQDDPGIRIRGRKDIDLYTN
jgi:hypothetical protein